MKVHFYAQAVVVQEEDEVLLVAFADHNVHPKETFMFQYALFEGPDQPIYCERNDQIQGCYNCIRHVVLNESSLLVTLNDKGIKHLNCDQIDISFKLTDADFTNLRNTLKQMLDYSRVLEII